MKNDSMCLQQNSHSLTELHTFMNIAEYVGDVSTWTVCLLDYQHLKSMWIWRLWRDIDYNVEKEWFRHLVLWRWQRWLSIRRIIIANLLHHHLPVTHVEISHYTQMCAQKTSSFLTPSVVDNDGTFMFAFRIPIFPTTEVLRRAANMVTKSIRLDDAQTEDANTLRSSVRRTLPIITAE